MPKLINIWEEVKKLGIEYDSHCSDLYIPVNEQTKLLLEKYLFKWNVTTFRNQIDNRLWYDIPFAYTPYYKKKQ